MVCLEVGRQGGGRVFPGRRTCAATPATCGAAIDVPDSATYSSVDPWHTALAQADVIFTPGAYMSMHLPKSENRAAVSSWLEAPTVMARGAKAGVCRQASQSLGEGAGRGER